MYNRQIKGAQVMCFINFVLNRDSCESKYCYLVCLNTAAADEAKATFSSSILFGLQPEAEVVLLKVSRNRSNVL